MPKFRCSAIAYLVRHPIGRYLDDNKLVIERLGFPSVEAYYAASSPLQLLSDISKPSLIIYGADDPLFHLHLVIDLQTACSSNSNIDLLVTRYGGHMAYLNSKQGQIQAQDPDIWCA